MVVVEIPSSHRLHYRILIALQLQLRYYKILSIYLISTKEPKLKLWYSKFTTLSLEHLWHLQPSIVIEGVFDQYFTEFRANRDEVRFLFDKFFNTHVFAIWQYSQFFDNFHILEFIQLVTFLQQCWCAQACQASD